MDISGREFADRIITYSGEHQPGLGRGVKWEEKYSEIGLKEKQLDDLRTILLELESEQLLRFMNGVEDGRKKIESGKEIPAMVLTLKGWDWYERLKQSNPKSSTAFMAMRFGDNQMNKMYTWFQATCNEIGYTLKTVDETPQAGLIDYQIRLQIVASRFVLADITHGNNGVYFEAGYAEGIGRPVIYTCRSDSFKSFDSKPHFDVSHHQCIQWDDPPTDEQLKKLRITIEHTLKC